MRKQHETLPGLGKETFEFFNELEITTTPQIKEGFFNSNENNEVVNETSNRLYTGNVRVSNDIVEYTLEVPEKLSYGGMAIFVPGYMGIKQSSSMPRKALADLGIATVSYGPARDDGHRLSKAILDPQHLHEKTIFSVWRDIQSRQERISSNAPNFDLIDTDRLMLFLHSMGGLSGPRFAVNHTKNVESIVGYATCGFGHPSLDELALDLPKRLMGSIYHELIPGAKSGAIDIGMRNILDIIKYIRSPRLIAEGLSCLRDSVYKEVHHLESNGVPYNYIGFEKDMLVRPDEDIANHVTNFSVIENYGHLAPQVKAQKVASLAVEQAFAA